MPLIKVDIATQVIKKNDTGLVSLFNVRLKQTSKAPTINEPAKGKKGTNQEILISMGIKLI